jgi:hypothetical protein
MDCLGLLHQIPLIMRVSQQRILVVGLPIVCCPLHQYHDLVI